MNVWRLGLLVLAAVLALGCRPQAKPVSLPPPESTNEVGPGDVFVMHIVGEDKLPTEYTVAPDGSVDVPYIERIMVDGLEPQQISALVRKQLEAEGILVQPSVIVSIKAFNSKRITVAGEVKEDGDFAFEPGMTLINAIAKAGGMTSLSNSWQVVLVRKTKKGPKKVIVDYDAISNNEIPDVPLQAGDRITVPQRAF
jgi:polysaccharide export outer membrane protein